MTVADMIARQTRIEHQDKPKAASVSFDGQAANVFQAYIGAALGFSLQRCGLLYGECDERTGAVLVHFIYEPPQQGRIDCVEMGDDEGQKAKADFIAAQLGYKNVRAPRVEAGGGGGGFCGQDGGGVFNGRVGAGGVDLLRVCAAAARLRAQREGDPGDGAHAGTALILILNPRSRSLHERRSRAQAAGGEFYVTGVVRQVSFDQNSPPAPAPRAAAVGLTRPSARRFGAAGGGRRGRPSGPLRGVPVLPAGASRSPPMHAAPSCLRKPAAVRCGCPRNPVLAGVRGQAADRWNGPR